MKTVTLSSPRRQSGAVLIVAMIILVILTLLGVTAMNTTSLQERIASNTQEQVHAFQAAETGLNQADSPRLLAAAPGLALQRDELPGRALQFQGDGNERHEPFDRFERRRLSDSAQTVVGPVEH